MNTLARMSFWVPPERLDDFEAVYSKRIVRMLKEHGLEESSECGRWPVEGVFSRLFEMETPAEVAAAARGLAKDLAWQEVLRNLGETFGTDQPEGLLRSRFGIYQTEAGSGRTVEAGMGIRRGSWLTFGVRDGLPSSIINDIRQDREGDLWFGTYGGVSRYDGEMFVTFTSEDGLGEDEVISILEDRYHFIFPQAIL